MPKSGMVGEAGDPPANEINDLSAKCGDNAPLNGKGNFEPSPHLLDLIACYRSGQITEAQWQQHLSDTPGLKEAWSSEQRGGGGARPLSARAHKLYERIQRGYWYRAQYGSEPKKPKALQELLDAGLIGVAGRPVMIVAAYVPTTGFTPFRMEEFATLTQGARDER